MDDLLKRVSRIRLAVDESELEFAPNMNSRGLVALPLEVRAA